MSRRIHFFSRDFLKKKSAKKPLHVSSKSVFQGRIYAVQSLFMMVAFVLLGRSFHLHIMDGEFLRGEGERRAVRDVTLNANRGMIVDRNGIPLAISTAVTTIYINPKQLIQKPLNWPILADSLGLSRASVETLIKENKTRDFVYLKRRLPPEEAKKALSLNILGVYSETEYRRYYPHGEIVSHITGFTDIDDKGKEGIELANNEALTGKSGLRRVVRDQAGHVVEDLGVLRLAEAGQNVELSLDLRMQYFAYRALLKGVQTFNAASGMAVALDVKTGEILVMVNQPSYNPNNLKSLDKENGRNRALTDVFEPGSTVKPFTVVAGLESGLFNPWTQIETTPGYYKVGRKMIRDHHNYGLIDVTGVITKSSNVGSSKIALSMPPQALVNVFDRVGLGKKLDIGFPGERKGALPHRNKWADIQVATLSFGYGMEVTALQLVQSYAVLASGGLKHPVSLIKRDAHAKNKLTSERVIEEDVAESVTRMLETVTGEEGTARAANLNGFRVAGKTGTVHKVQNGRYVKEYRSLFVGFAPVEKPEIAMVVIIDDPKGKKHFGGEVAAPVFADIMDHLLRIKNAAPDKTIQPIQALMMQPSQFAVR